MNIRNLLIGLHTLILSLFLISCDSSQSEKIVIQSPDKNVVIEFSLINNNQASYSVSYKDQEVIQPSLLGLELLDGGVLSYDLEILEISSLEISETYPVYAGKSNEAINHCNEKIISLQETTDPYRSFNIAFRAYNDGIAFRYIVPEQESISEYILKKEETYFTLPENTNIWALHLNTFHSAYENYYLKGNLNDITKKSLIGLPMTFKIGDKVAGVISEAGLTDYAGMYLSKGEDGSIKSVLSPRLDKPEVAVIAEKGFKSPWRAIILGDSELDLIPSNLIMNLNPPCKVKDPSFIKPAKCAWDWWNYQTIPEDADFKQGMNNETMKYYIDFASEFKLETMLIDAGWYGDANDTTADLTTCIDGFDIEELVKYAAKRDVDIHVWSNWVNFDNQMEEILTAFNKWGVKGVKIDFMGRDDQEMVDFYNRTAERAAKHKIIVNFHGAYKPTGIRRTWPNVMSREGIMGLEHLRAGGRVNPIHNVTIPYTRMTVGPMDYTPGGFLNVNRENYQVFHKPPTVLGTRCHHLAIYSVYESPLQMVSDWPGAYRGAKGSGFLKVVPASFDKTLPLKGEIGKYIVMAKKSGNDWFMGAMTDWDEGRFQLIPTKNLIARDGSNGLTGTYYEGDNFDKEVKIEVNEVINYKWPVEGPKDLPDDHFSIRWEGKIKPDVGGEYTIVTFSDDGVRLWINDELLIDEWRKQASFERGAKINLEAGKEYDIKIEYFEGTGGAEFNLKWETPSAKTNDSWVHREVDVNLDFLDEDNEYTATIYKDCEATIVDAKELEIETKTVRKGDPLKIQMAEGGGMAVHLKKQ